MKVPASVTKAYAAARKVRASAHAPYSKFKVGAVLIGKSGATFTGCNIENASYGGTVCAERVAILKAVSEGEDKFADIVVVTDGAAPAFPCALCLQVMAEFFDSKTKIWIADLEDIRSVHTFAELLPVPFGPKQLALGRIAKKKS